MHGLAVRQKDNPKVPALHLVNSRPTPDAAVSLDVLPLGVCDDTFYPIVSNERPIGTRPNGSKIFRNIHDARVLTVTGSLPSSSEGARKSALDDGDHDQ